MFKKNFFYNSICHVCKEFRSDLKRCGSCKFISYCSKEHQVSDWKNHKQLCKALADSKNFVKLEENCGYERWRTFRTYLQFYLKQTLERELLPFESQIWMFPRNCTVCYSAEGLRDCQKCLCVAYCSAEHQNLDAEAHKAVCSELKLCLESDRFYMTNPKVDVRFKEIDHNTRHLPRTAQDSIECFLNTSELHDPLEKIFVTDIFAGMLTILYGLETCQILSDRNLRSGNLVIHLVGADISELSMNWNCNIKLLQKWIKNLEICKLILIGPDCDLASCNICDSDKIKVECFSDFYHNVVGEIEKADIIVALNSGLHEFESNEADDTWCESLSKLVNNNAPLLLTAYTKKELEEDLKRMDVFSIKKILDVQRNMFSNVSPIRDWDSKDNIPFYVNGYISIIASNDHSAT